MKYASISTMVRIFTICLVVVGSIWGTYMFFGFTVSSFAFAYIFSLHADTDLSAAVSANYVLLMYLMVLVTFTMLAHGKIVYSTVDHE